MSLRRPRLPRASARTACVPLALGLVLGVAGSADAGGGYVAQSRADIRAVFPAAVAAKAIAVARCESGLNPRAIGGSGSHRYYGLFQMAAGTLRSVGSNPREAMNGRRNAQAAYRLWRRAGWRPWGCR